MGILTYDDENFYMDGERFTILSGTIHYFRVVPEYWEDRLKKLKACGFNTVETYTCWNLHEPREGEFDFSDMLDLERFIDTAARLGLYVILRPGPYICAEWDFGGLPSWLLTYPHLRLRCHDEVFLSKVRRYYKELLGRIRPKLSTNGGNIIMVQIENEYGSYGNDKQYLQAIADIYQECGIDCLLFTSDGQLYFMLNGGTLDGYLATVNFGDDPAYCFRQLKEYRPKQPLMCCEFWDGAFDHWYEEHHTRSSDTIAQLFDEILSAGASVNFYMFHGGTNFGFTNGANYFDRYLADVTSYDYDAPLSEAGDMTEKYYALQAVIEKHFGKVPEIAVSNMPKQAYGAVELPQIVPLFDSLSVLSQPVSSAFPLSMEELGQSFGFVLYRTTVKGPLEELKLEIDRIRDRALVFVNGSFNGVMERGRQMDEIKIQLPYEGEIQLDILVENMGRINYGPKMRDEKGILGGVRLGQQYHFGWTLYPLPLDNLSKLPFRNALDHKPIQVPSFLRGTFTVAQKADTFLRLDGFTKGVAYINGFNLGRYWNAAGPQKTLYIPAPLLREGENEIVVFELEGFKEGRVTLVDKPDLGG